MQKNIQVSTLPNGLRVVSDNVDSVETVSLGLWVGAGSRDENEADNGVAHMLEHMVFKGTERRTARDIAEEIEAVGGLLNAYTDREVTGFDAKVLREDLPLGIELIADMIQNPRFDGEEMERERQVILQEIGQSQDTPDDIVFDHLQGVAFPDQILGRPILGTPDTVAALDRDALIAFRAAHYRPENLVFSACGRVDHDALCRRVEDAFSALPGTEAAAGKRPSASYGGGAHTAALPLEQLHLVIGFERPGLHDPDHYAIRLLAMLLGGGMASRLFQEIREKRGLVYAVECFDAAYADSGLMLIYAGTSGERAGEYIDALAGELSSVCLRQALEKELDRVKTQVRAAILMREESIAARCDFAAQQLLKLGKLVPPAEIVERIAALTAEDIQRAATRLFNGRPSIAALGPGADRLADSEAFATRIARGAGV